MDGHVLSMRAWALAGMDVLSGAFEFSSIQ